MSWYGLRETEPDCGTAIRKDIDVNPAMLAGSDPKLARLPL